MLFLIGGAFAAMFIGGRGRRRANGMSDAAMAATRIRDEFDAVYCSEHVYMPATLTNSSDADLSFYDRVATDLERRNYRRVGDVEDVTLSRVYPHMRTLLRVFIDDGQVISVVAYEFRPRGPMVAALQLLSASMRRVRVVELTSEATNGRALITANTRGLDRLDASPQVSLERMDPTTAVAALLTRHRERLIETSKRDATWVPVPMANLDDALASRQRSHARAARHRGAQGRLSRDELERIKGSPLAPLDEEFLNAVQAREDVAPTSGAEATEN